ncbi:MAG: hypothetical protein UX17_C0003G0008 [Parcubacteria group bacterium GW2011_GWC2_45_7]|nr:MAG: hypothetical protein UX17_C0003G0008 [Parcubacteria group bacterium GW2011_GWC2_45_7]
MQLKNIDEAHRFFRDLCTLEEIDEMARRWQVAMMLAKNRPYRKIAQEVSVSTSTVTRVSHWINQGMGGYKLILQRLKLL